MIPIRKSVPRQHGRRTFDGWLERGWLTIKRGCWRRTITKLGDVIADSREKDRVPWWNVDDHLVLTGTPIDENAVARIQIVDPSALRFAIRIVSGKVSDGNVYVLPAWKAKIAQARKRAA